MHHGYGFRYGLCHRPIDVQDSGENYCNFTYPRLLQSSGCLRTVQNPIWGLIEAHYGGYFQSVLSLLLKIDHAQNRFLGELEASLEQAFLDFNAAPPRIRRNIAVLGLLQKRIIGKCHPSFQRLLRGMRNASRNLDQCRVI